MKRQTGGNGNPEFGSESAKPRCCLCFARTRMLDVVEMLQEREGNGGLWLREGKEGEKGEGICADQNKQA